MVARAGPLPHEKAALAGAQLTGLFRIEELLIVGVLLGRVTPH